MRLNKQKVFRTALVGYFLASTFILSGAAFANTEASEEVSTVPSTTQSEKAVSSSSPELPTLNSSKEDVPTASTLKVEEPKRELTYEDNQMLEEPKADSPVPAVHFQEKQLENGLTIKGSVSAGAEVRENVPSWTILSALILQRLTESGTWQEVYRFSIEGNGVNVTDSAFSFDYEKPVTETGESNYRLAADYTVKYSEEDQEQQKASLEVGSVTKVKEEVQEKPSETASSSQESTNSEQESTEATKGSIVESSGPKEDSNAEEPIVIDPSTMGTGDDSPKTLGNNSQIPAMQDNYREAFQRGMGIVPMASPIVSPIITNPKSSSGDSSIRVDIPTVISAQYTSRTKATMKVQLVWDYMGYGSGMSIDENTATTEIDKKTYAFTVTLGHSQWKAAVKGDLKLSSLTASSTDGYYHGRLSKLTNQRTITVEHPNMFRWEGWSKNVTEFEFTDLPVGDITWLEFTVKPNYTGASQFEFGFTPPTIADLTEVSQPVFTATDGVTNKVTMERGTYTGDISEDTNDGIFELSINKGQSYSNHTNVTHDTEKSRYYHKKDIENLTAGMEYRGRVGLKDWLGVLKYSANNKFCTPNSVNKPSSVVLGDPTNAHDATATIKATYNVGSVPAHPSAVDVQISKDQVKWSSWTANTTSSIDTNVKQVTYTLKGLDAYTKYYTRYRVKNESEHWSPFSAIDYSFTTKAIPVEFSVSPPEFFATDTVTNKVTMKQGTYTGNIAGSKGVFKIFENGAWSVKYNDMNHSGTPSGTYYSREIEGLEVGTKYEGLVSFKEESKPWKDSTSASFYTPNSIAQHGVKSQNIPTTMNDSSVTFEGNYAASSVTPAHPKEVQIEYGTDGISWFPGSNASATSSINEASRKVEYTLNDLTTKTDYYTRYRVKNDSKAWSNWSTLSFKTDAVPLKVSTPIFDQANATTNQITMKDGTYTGHVSTNINDINKGSIDLSTDNESTWSGYTGTLPYTTTLNGTYNSLLLTGLSTGTTYKIRVGLKDDSRAYVYSNPTGTFYTRNSVNKPIIDTLHLPISRYNASATISGVYGIGPAGTTPAHPDKVKVQVKLDGAPNWEDVDSSSSPKLDSQSINTSSTKGTFTISKLKASTKYHVRYQVENQGGWSDWSASEEFETLAPPAALEIIDAPKLDFGMLQSEKFTQTANLSAASQKNHLTVDNTDTTKGWKLTAALQQLKRTDNPSIVMPWAKLTMPINLQNSTDDGITWSNYATGVDGIPRTMSFNSGDPAQKLWGIVNPTDAQGFFRTEIDWSNVELEVPGNQYELYEGKLVWSLDDTP
ncbi:hypothetical protein JZO81_18850 [Enterococcus hulanensis]|uniref:hypothetical protein n=1 Tax=Enterococcus TaxID=1350 RepID=UPI000B5A9C28|nr:MULTISPECIES: hypothetical protein [Enterococcus]MBO0413118.1 hypothetical protein [Enterococcus hulanensis]OTO15262.1 hypothetical protein A5875_004420 [Enterococcus sp. 3H8_DIV0648]